MTSWVVADSGILLSTVLDEPLQAQAIELWEAWKAQDIRVAAPILFQYEIVAVPRKHVHRGILSVEKGNLIPETLLQIPVVCYISPKLLFRAYELATELNRPTAYDSQYLALAESLHCDFWTADEKLFNAVGNRLSWVKWLGNYPLQTQP